MDPTEVSHMPKPKFPRRIFDATSCAICRK